MRASSPRGPGFRSPLGCSELLFPASVRQDWGAHPPGSAPLPLCITRQWQHSRKSQCQRLPLSVTDFLPLPIHLGYQPPPPHPRPGLTGIELQSLTQGSCPPGMNTCPLPLSPLYPPLCPPSAPSLYPLPLPPCSGTSSWMGPWAAGGHPLLPLGWQPACYLPFTQRSEGKGQRPKAKKPPFQVERSRSCPPNWRRERNLQVSRTSERWGEGGFPWVLHGNDPSPGLEVALGACEVVCGDCPSASCAAGK